MVSRPSARSVQNSSGVDASPGKRQPAPTIASGSAPDPESISVGMNRGRGALAREPVEQLREGVDARQVVRCQLLLGDADAEPLVAPRDHLGEREGVDDAELEQGRVAVEIVALTLEELLHHERAKRLYVGLGVAHALTFSSCAAPRWRRSSFPVDVRGSSSMNRTRSTTM